MSLRWRVVGMSAVALALALCFAAVLRLQLRSDAAGWTLSFGRDDFDPQAFKRNVLAAAEQQNQASRREWIRQVRSEIARSRLDLTHEQEALLTVALERMDSRIAGRIRSSEGDVREDTQKLVTEMYAMLAQQRAQDLEAINLRFERNDANNAIKAQQTNEILGTLLQVADLGLSKK